MTTPLLQIEQFSFHYANGRLALDRVSLRGEAGERIGLVGPNGAGKSTLLGHLNGVLYDERLMQGRLAVAGLELSRRNLRAVRARVGLVFQNPDDQLFSTTVFDDVAFGPLHLGRPPEQVRQQVAWALAQVGMAGAEERMPHHLSLGERKRVAIATVLAMPTELLALDEPTAGLDPRGRRELVALLRTLPQALLVATHDMRLVWELCPRTVVLDGGRIVADGPTEELLQDAALLERHGLESPFALPEGPVAERNAPSGARER